MEVKQRELTLPRIRAGTQLLLVALLPGAVKEVVVVVVMEVVDGEIGESLLLVGMVLKAGTQWMLAVQVQAKSSNLAHGVSSLEQPLQVKVVVTAVKAGLITETGHLAWIIHLCYLGRTWTREC